MAPRARVPGCLVACVAVGCATAAPCPPERVCGAASWLEQGSFVEGRMVLAQVTQVGVLGGGLGRVAREALPLEPGPVLLRFDLAPLAGATGVERAVLALAPHPAWRTTRDAPRLRVRAALGRWTAASVAEGTLPPVAAVEDASATLTARVRAPVRLDVTRVVRAWQSGALPPEGLALEVAPAGVVFVGAGALALADRPRLEVVLR